MSYTPAQRQLLQNAVNSMAANGDSGNIPNIVNDFKAKYGTQMVDTPTTANNTQLTVPAPTPPPAPTQQPYQSTPQQLQQAQQNAGGMDGPQGQNIPPAQPTATPASPQSFLQGLWSGVKNIASNTEKSVVGAVTGRTDNLAPAINSIPAIGPWLRGAYQNARLLNPTVRKDAAAATTPAQAQAILNGGMPEYTPSDILKLGGKDVINGLLSFAGEVPLMAAKAGVEGLAALGDSVPAVANVLSKATDLSSTLAENYPKLTKAIGYSGNVAGQAALGGLTAAAQSMINGDTKAQAASNAKGSAELFAALGPAGDILNAGLNGLKGGTNAVQEDELNKAVKLLDPKFKQEYNIYGNSENKGLLATMKSYGFNTFNKIKSAVSSVTGPDGELNLANQEALKRAAPANLDGVLNTAISESGAGVGKYPTRNLTSQEKDIYNTVSKGIEKVYGNSGETVVGPSTSQKTGTTTVDNQKAFQFLQDLQSKVYKYSTAFSKNGDVANSNAAASFKKIYNQVHTALFENTGANKVLAKDVLTPDRINVIKKISPQLGAEIENVVKNGGSIQDIRTLQKPFVDASQLLNEIDTKIGGESGVIKGPAPLTKRIFSRVPGALLGGFFGHKYGGVIGGISGALGGGVGGVNQEELLSKNKLLDQGVPPSAIAEITKFLARYGSTNLRK